MSDANNIDANKIHSDIWHKVINQTDELYTLVNSYYNDKGTFYEFLQDIGNPDTWPEELYNILTAEHMWLVQTMIKLDIIKAAFYEYCLCIGGGLLPDDSTI